MEDKKNKHLLVRKYLEEHSFVESNITSFNNDWQLVLWLAVIIGLIFVAYKIFNGNKL